MIPLFSFFSFFLMLFFSFMFCGYVLVTLPWWHHLLHHLSSFQNLVYLKGSDSGGQAFADYDISKSTFLFSFFFFFLSPFLHCFATWILFINPHAPFLSLKMNTPSSHNFHFCHSSQVPKYVTFWFILWPRMMKEVSLGSETHKAMNISTLFT